MFSNCWSLFSPMPLTMPMFEVVSAGNLAIVDIDWWSQTISAPCCASILCCSVFQGQWQRIWLRRSWSEVPWCCTPAFIAQCIANLLLLRYVVPLFGFKILTFTRLRLDPSVASFSRLMARLWLQFPWLGGALVLYTGLHCTLHCPHAAADICSSSFCIQDLDPLTIEA